MANSPHQNMEGKPANPSIGSLVEINADLPGGLAKICRLAETHDDVDQIVGGICNEVGRAIYEEDYDINALNRRFNFRRLDMPLVPQERLSLVFEEEYYRTSLSSIEESRAVLGEWVDRVDEAALVYPAGKPLRTEGDYMEYFEGLHPKVLDFLIKELLSLEINEGCKGECRVACIAGVQEFRHAIPLEIYRFLLKKAKAVRDKNALPLSIQWASDLRDHPRRIDLIKEYDEIFGSMPEIYTSFSLCQETIDFLYELVVENSFKVSCISRLTRGRKDNSLDELLNRVSQRAGRPLREQEIENITDAFLSGGKDGLNIIAGNAIEPDTSESQISTDVVNGSHGVIFRAGRGFFANVARPTSRLFKSGGFMYPLIPNADGIICVPHGQFSVYSPGSFDRINLVLRPRFTHINFTTGEVVRADDHPPHITQILDISSFKRAARNIFLTLLYHSSDGRPTDVSEQLLDEYCEGGIRHNDFGSNRMCFDECKNLIEFIYRRMEQLLDVREDLMKKYLGNSSFTDEIFYLDNMIVELLEGVLRNLDLLMNLLTENITRLNSIDQRVDPCVLERFIKSRREIHKNTMYCINKFMQSIYHRNKLNWPAPLDVF